MAVLSGVKELAGQKKANQFAYHAVGSWGARPELTYSPRIKLKLKQT